MKLFRIILCTVFLALPVSSSAWFPHGYVPAIQPNTSLSAINVVDSAMLPFVNLMKMAATFYSNSNVTFVYPNFLQQGTNLPTGTLPSRLGFGVRIPSNYFGEFVLNISGTISGTSAGFNQGATATFGQVYAIGAGTTLSGCTNGNVPPCYFNNNLALGGTNPQVTLDFSTPITGVANNGSGLVRLSIPNTANGVTNGLSVTVSGVVGSDGNGCGANGTFTTANETTTTVDLTGSTFDPGCTYSSGGQLFQYQSGLGVSVPFGFNAGTYSGMSSIVFCKLADFNADNTCQTTAGHTAWAGGFNDDFVTKIATLRPHHIRFLDANTNVFRIPPDWNGSPSTSAVTYNAPSSFFALTNWFGSTSGTNSYSISCSAPCTYTLSGGAPQDGDFIQFYNVNASTNSTPTIAITDANSVTSSAYPLLAESSARGSIKMTGSATTGDTVALQFNTTPLGAYTCLAGGTHTTTPYTVLNTDTLSTIGTQLINIVNADATLIAQPQTIYGANPFSNGSIGFGYASNACAVTVSLVVTGAGTETASIGTMTPGGMAANTIYTAVYKSLHNAFVVNTNDLGGFSGSWPYSVQVALANAVSTKSGLQTGCWIQPNLLWSNASFTSLANFLAANQCPGETILELGNEVWNGSNSITGESANLAASLGLVSGHNADSSAYYELRQRQLWAIASSAFGGLTGNLWTSSMFQLGSVSSNELAGNTLCGTSCGNQAYQNAVGVDYNVSPNRPVDYTRVIGQAPYYQGAVLDGNGYSSSGGYGSWSATSSSVASNVLTVSGTVTGTIWWNHGISSCDGVYIYASNPNDPTSAQLTGTVTTTTNGSFGDNTATWTLTSVAGISAGMWMYDRTTGMIDGTVGSVNSGANQVTITANKKTYRTAGANDTMVFGGLAGTYQLNSTTCAASSGTITGGDVLGLQYAADNYNGVNGAIGSQQDALNWAYQDTLVAAKNNQMPITVTVRSMVNAYNIINNVANTYSLPVWDYEGAYQAQAPSTGQATSMGLPSSAYGGANGYVNLLLTAFKNSASFKQIETTRHNNELALLPTNSMTMWYTFEGSSQPRWGLFPHDLYSTPYQSYNAICDYNGGSC
jgi:hypothetical protein